MKPPSLRIDARDRIVDQRVEIGDAGLFKIGPVGRIVEFLKDILEMMVIGLGDGILGGKPQILNGV
jgi:hypothetical protein